MEGTTAKRIIVRGLVQGVGFRPFIYRMAKRLKLCGWVENRNDAVVISVEGMEDSITSFEQLLASEHPKIATIQSIESSVEDPEMLEDFTIKWSKDIGDRVTEISPDIAICQDCLNDMHLQNHRLDYSFINCTNCGPRFSIITDLPYDRKRTTMDSFKMCDQCRSEYENIIDRRFHAQPVACKDCGPAYTLTHGDKQLTDFSTILRQLSELIEGGGIAVIKGIGGYFIVCDALNEKAVNRIRNIKHRYGKPFAVMFRDIVSISEYVEMDKIASEQIESWRRPIVIMKAKKELPKSVSNDFPTIGAMLPYLPLHYQLFEHLSTSALVMTSGNFSEEPIIIDDQKAKEQFSSRVDAIMINNREIYNRVDDSVMIISGEKPRMIRRSRGYVPEPILLQKDVDGILAVGAELVNCVCVGKENKAILSQHIGDLQNPDTLEFFEESLDRFLKLFRIKPRLVAHDMHPDYLSSKYAQNLDLPKIQVQHHHAHILSAMAEFGLKNEVIGISLDGTGLGTDGHIWGSEFLICNTKSFTRSSHFGYIPMPGGDLAVREPWRMALAYLYKLFGKESIGKHAEFFKEIPETKIDWVVEALDKSVNTPLSCGSGRLFDAVAALLGICTHSSFHAEAPMRLEAIAKNDDAMPYEFNFGSEIKFIPMFEEILTDLHNGIPRENIAGRFQNTIIEVIITGAVRMRMETGINHVVLSGGTFQNQYISERAEKMLILRKFNVYIPSRVPANDGGIALGQLLSASNYL